VQPVEAPKKEEATKKEEKKVEKVEQPSKSWWSSWFGSEKK